MTSSIASNQLPDSSEPPGTTLGKGSGSDRRRLFLAVPWPATEPIISLFNKLRQQLQELGVAGKWTSPRQIHFTLLFLGDRTQDESAIIVDTARQIADQTDRFSLTSKLIASFHRRPRLLFLDWREDPPQAMENLALLLKTSLAQKIEIDPRTLQQSTRPHTTLVRFRSPRDQSGLKTMAPHSDIERGLWQWPELPTPSPPVQVNCQFFCLYQSRLTSSGAIHTELNRFELH